MIDPSLSGYGGSAQPGASYDAGAAAHRAARPDQIVASSLEKNQYSQGVCERVDGSQECGSGFDV
jgi:hypothetical protein